MMMGTSLTRLYRRVTMILAFSVHRLSCCLGEVDPPVLLHLITPFKQYIWEDVEVGGGSQA